MHSEQLKQAFKKIYGLNAEVNAYAPGRVNLIGEHTDYNQGFVFPVAINFGTSVSVSLRQDKNCKAIAMDFDCQETFFSLDDIRWDNSHSWANYVRGVLKVIQDEFSLPCGLNMAISGNVPQGAGLSSSASLEMAIARAISELYSLNIDGVQAALMGQRAENEFVGCSCGIMDQLISAMGKKDNAMLLDCRSLDFELTTLPDNLSIVIINSNVKRGLADSEYNLRRSQCEQAASLLNVNSLRDVSLSTLKQAKDRLPESIHKRARHVITENARTRIMFEAFKNNDIRSISVAMHESHISMRDDFQITIPQIDYLVEIISTELNQSGGVRMTGGGFGGCVVGLIPNNLVEEVKKLIENLYFPKTGLHADIYVCTTAGGAFQEV